MASLELKGVRKPVIAGTWYPGRPEELNRMISSFLAKVEIEPVPGELVGLVAPHAGYIYSGQVAAYAYKQIEGRSFETVVVVHPSHRLYLDGYALTAAAFYETPLGQIPLDGEVIAELDEELKFTFLRSDQEHSLEIQLPFLQYVLGNFKLVPVMMGDQSWDRCQKLASALVKVLKGKQALLVASSDLSHFYSYRIAVSLDKVVLNHVESYDPEGLARAITSGKAEACGGGPIVAVMLASKELGADRAKVLKYANSGDVTGDFGSVVGYMAAAFYREAT
ncbi:MAG: AmmeMemoRadiSam system protein B [Anaerolineae bacterium]|nr:AmmeMemoRadiSam system protein B [Anaerolineae bacterium]MDW8101642.1 AmmeMemoRadiSam system protein B [Anaerolineae bacterium]